MERGGAGADGGPGPGAVGYFLAEIGVYVAVTWAAALVPAAAVVRVVLALATLAAFAVAWGLVASPRAPHPLPRGADRAFRVAWFALGALAAAVVVAHLLG